MTVRLRAHHLLCILTYIGRGYSPAFTANYDDVVARLAAGEDISLVHGPDDICAPLLGDAEPHCHKASVRERDARAHDAIMPLLKIVDEHKIRLTAADVRCLRDHFAAGTIRAACRDCEWSGLCDGIAGTDFAAVRL